MHGMGKRETNFVQVSARRARDRLLETRTGLRFVRSRNSSSPIRLTGFGSNPSLRKPSPVLVCRYSVGRLEVPCEGRGRVPTEQARNSG